MEGKVKSKNFCIKKNTTIASIFFMLSGCSTPPEPSDKDLFKAINQRFDIINERELSDLNAEFYEKIELKSAEKVKCKFNPDEVSEYYICTVKISTSQGNENRTGNIVISIFYRGGEGWIADEL